MGAGATSTATSGTAAAVVAKAKQPVTLAVGRRCSKFALLTVCWSGSAEIGTRPASRTFLVFGFDSR